MSQIARNYQRVNPERLHDVDTNARRLSTLYTVEVELARLNGGWVPRAPELPEKLTLGRLTYEDADHARLLEERLIELRVSPAEVADLRKRTVPALKRLELLEDEHAFMSGLFRVVKPALIADMRRHLDSSPPYVDDPTRRFLEHSIREEEEHVAAGLAILADRGIAWDRYLDLENELRGSLWDSSADDGGFLAGDYVGKDPVDTPIPAWPENVEQLRYEQPQPAYPRDFDGAMRRCIHDLVFSETEALDIFGRYVYEFPQFPWQFHFEAARICWDEARHVELLLNVLDRYDGKVGDFPAKAPGYEEFYRQDGLLEKIIMVNVIAEGEVSTDTQTQHRDAFRELGDELSALLKDYEMADEVVHGRFGLKWARWYADQTGNDYEAAYQRAAQALEDFKSMHDAGDEDAGESPIPLVRLGVDETGDKRVVNVAAKRLVGFTDEEISKIAPGATLVDR